MTVDWIIPTVKGREESFERAQWYPLRHDTDIVVLRDHPTCGEAWVKGARERDGDYIYFAADDIDAHDGFLETMIETVDDAYHPAAIVKLPDGTKQSCGGRGPDVCRWDCVDWAYCDWSPTPFIRREWWPIIEPHAEMLADLHYHSDVLVSWALAREGIPSAVRTPAVITHYNHPVKRGGEMGSQHDRAWRDYQAFHEYTRRVAA